MTTNLLFGSCNRQNLPQDYWDYLASLRPNFFFWIGDAVYSTGNSLDNMREAYESQSNNKYYKNFQTQSNLVIDGVWDDHDYGVNDAGKLITHKSQRQKTFLDFLQIPESSIRRKQDGLYHFTDISHNQLKCRILFLDTRTFRDSHFIRSIGEIHFPFTAYVAAATRAISALLGYNYYFKGDILGDSQWKWLERNLNEQSIDVFIIVSSIQILTTNIIVESWNHFPKAKLQLFHTLKHANPKEVIFFSGDVHHGELSKISFQREDNSYDQWIEVTTSGLTHSCSGISSWTKSLCPIMLKTFPKHRLYQDAFFTERNFGIIEISDIYNQPHPFVESPNNSNINNNNDNNSTLLKIGVRDIANGNYQLSYDINIPHFHNNNNNNNNNSSNNNNNNNSYYNKKPFIKSFQYTEFPSYPVLGHTILIIFLSLVLALIRIIVLQYLKRPKTITQKLKKMI